MSALKIAAPLLLFTTCFCGVSHAQLSTPLYKTTYCVQVKYEMWRSGISYWSTEFETSNQADAELIFDLFDAALEAGSICGILNCSPDWIIVDVRLKPKYEWYIPVKLDWRSSVLRRKL